MGSMPESPTPRLLVTDASGQRLVQLDKPTLTLGRRRENDVCIPDAGVSRLHAEVISEADRFFIRDCGSKFGTFINGDRKTEHILQHGDRIRLGQVEDIRITFLIDDEEPSREHSVVAAASELRHTAQLLEGLRALGSSRVLEDVLALVLDAAIDVTGAERGFIMLATDRGDLEFKLARGRGRFTMSGRTFETSRKIPETVFATGHAAFVEDLADQALAGQHQGTIALGIRHVLCTPLRLVQLTEHREARGEQPIIGVLYLDSREKSALHSASTRAAVDMLSSEAAVAIENARLYRDALEGAKLEQELKVAAAIQQSLLPDGRRSGAFFSASAASVPCRAVGGDFFDYVDLPSGQFGFILGDVAGKGSPAALLAAAVLGMFGAEAGYQPEAGPVLERLNRGLFRRRIEARFVTAFYGAMAPDGRLTYCNAGHNPPVLVTKTGIRRLDVGGLVLGLFETSIFEQETVQLEPGDVVVVFSDGVTEAEEANGDQFGDERLLALVDEVRDAPAPVVLDRVLAEVREFRGPTLQTDDVTAIVVRYNGTA